LTRYLIGQQGKAHFLKFLSDGMEDENWPRAVKAHYGHESLYSLQNEWLEWVKQGRPLLAGEFESAPRRTPVVQASGSVPVESTAGVSSAAAADEYESAYSQPKERVIRR